MLEETTAAPEQVTEAVRINTEGRSRALRICFFALTGLALIAISPRVRSPAISVTERVGTVGWFRGPGGATVEVASTVLAGVAVTTGLV